MILGACAYDTHFEDCAVHCTDDMECPTGLACEAEGFCRTPGSTEMCAAVETFPSCVGLAATCGPNADEDCCSTATPIPGGTFFRSYDVAEDGTYANSSYLATVSPFVLDRFEVTVGRFRRFVKAGLGTQENPPPIGAGSRRFNETDGQGGWNPEWSSMLPQHTAALAAAVKCDVNYQTWTDDETSASDVLPINCVTWYEAMAFCIWDGGHLPTEAEWNFAASGGIEQRAYPWSSPGNSLEIDCAYANYNGDLPSGTYCANGTVGGALRVGSESSNGDARWGHADLAGSVWAWTLDSYSTYPMPCDNCANLTVSPNRVLRGGSFFDRAPILRVGFRYELSSTVRGGSIGVRCARSAL